jgi:hypothetical protein
MGRRHGQIKQHFRVGDELFVEQPGSGGGARFLAVTGHASAASFGLAAPPAGAVVEFRFGRLFSKPVLPEYRPEAKALTALGLSMEERKDNPVLDRGVPAGYTYLGQFIDHDMTFFDETVGFEGDLEPEDVESGRSPALDLDSVYGLGPELEKTHPSGRKIYEDDGIRMRVGMTKDDHVSDEVAPKLSFPNDLPRRKVLKEGLPPEKQVEAMIADPRNDENLALAQTHVAFIRFHNAVVERLSNKYQGTQLFEEARKKVRQHYQWIILRDYLPRVIRADVLDDVIEHGCRHFNPGENAHMPVEFSVAAFRLGHAMVRNFYQWNGLFQSNPPGRHRAATLSDLFERTGRADPSLLATDLGLQSSWVIDWTRFYDFKDFPGVANNAHSNAARGISPSLTSPLMTLRGTDKKEPPSLAVRNLLRGRLLGLPAGQSVADRLGVEKPLKPEEIADGPHRDVLVEHGFQQLTPLWYYILKEAEAREDGKRLGEVGSRIVAETFVALIKASQDSILADAAPGKKVKEPDLGPVKENRFDMPDLLFFVHDSSKESFLNPI